MKRLKRILVVFRMLFLGWDYESIVGKTEEAELHGWTMLNFQQAMTLKYFGVMSVRPHPTIGKWEVWSSDLCLRPNWKRVACWLLEGDGAYVTYKRHGG